HRYQANGCSRHQSSPVLGASRLCTGAIRSAAERRARHTDRQQSGSALDKNIASISRLALSKSSKCGTPLQRSGSVRWPSSYLLVAELHAATDYSSVTQPSLALLTFLMYLNSVPRV